ncbi:hypothetical protein [Streptomyces sp. NPDC051994]|uniref:hypothetical protein n=1 Tax=unclassified Streptomyces TaxID=2593676 RepID=UPI0034292AA9
MTEPLTPEREAEIRARAEAATEGPWHVEDHKPSLERLVVDEDGLLSVSLGYLGNSNQPDARFIAHAREDVPALLAELDRVREVMFELLPGGFEGRASAFCREGLHPTTVFDTAEVPDGWHCPGCQLARWTAAGRAE